VGRGGFPRRIGSIGAKFTVVGSRRRRRGLESIISTMNIFQGQTGPKKKKKNQPKDHNEKRKESRMQVIIKKKEEKWTSLLATLKTMERRQIRVGQIREGKKEWEGEWRKTPLEGLSYKIIKNDEKGMAHTH